MGWSKYYEDNRIIVEEKGHFFDNKNITKRDELLTSYFCLYCNCIFDSKEELFSHIRNKHNIVNPVIMINNKIYNNEEDVFIMNVESAFIYTYGFKECIMINNIEIDLSNDSIDIKNQIKECFISNKFCDIYFGDKRIRIHKYTEKDICNSKVSSIIEEWNDMASQNKTINLPSSSNFNPTEQRYLSGFYNYFLACNASGVDKRNRYNDALHLLKAFSDLNVLTITVLKVLFFRLNWINELDKLCNNYKLIDEFNIINDFYHNEKRNYKFSSKPKGQLYIEDDLRKNIEAITNYIDGKIDLVKNYITKNDHIFINDINMKDRVLFLKGKIELDKNNNLKAKKLFNEIQNEFLNKEKDMVK